MTTSNLGVGLTQPFGRVIEFLLKLIWFIWGTQSLFLPVLLPERYKSNILWAELSQLVQEPN